MCLGIGIGIYFLLGEEPGAIQLGCGLALVVALLTGAYLARGQAAPILIALALVQIGVGLGAWRTHSRAAPVLEFRYYGPVQGRIVTIDRSQSDVLRLTLDRVVLDETSPERAPERVRVSVHGAENTEFLPGRVVLLTGHLSAPQGPAEPGDFDFRRHAWFDRLGAVGYTRTPILALEDAKSGFGIAIFDIRVKLSDHIRTRLPGQVGAFAAALVTGDRSGINQQTTDEMRASNLSHLLSISGLHMGLLVGVTFAAVRFSIACVPWVALRVNGKKCAAILALVAAIAYLGLSGGNVATQRSFIMVAVMLGAVMLDRRAFSIRSIALAGLILLVFMPETLLDPGFQMSFAATAALIWAFGEMTGWGRWSRLQWVRPVLTLVLSSVVAGLATAPIGAAHFNQTSTYGLLANLLSVPVMGSVVAPAAVAAFVLSAAGLEMAGLWVMGKGVAWILFVGRQVAELDGAVRLVTRPDAVVLPVLAMGAIWFILMRGPVRHVGAVAMVLALGLWVRSERPLAIISDDAALVGVMTDAGRILNKPRGAGFAANAWLENDGDAADQTQASARRAPDADIFEVELGGLVLRHLGASQAKRAENACDGADVLVVAATIDNAGDCLVIGPETTKLTGALALSLAGSTVQAVSAQVSSGTRPWSSTTIDGAAARSALAEINAELERLAARRCQRGAADCPVMADLQ